MRKLLLVIAVVSAAVFGCKGGGTGEKTTSQGDTIPAAAAQPAPTGTEAMTQTVDIEDSRTDAEGGTLTQQETATTSTAAAAKKKTGAAAASRKQPTSQSKPAGRTQ